jgi:hypothetical protein
MKSLAIAVVLSAMIATPAVAQDRKVNGSFTETPGASAPEASERAAPTAAERPAVNEYGDKKRDGTYGTSGLGEPSGAHSEQSEGDTGAKARETQSRVIGLSAQDLARRIAQTPRQAPPGAPPVDAQELREKINERTGGRDRGI